MGSGESNTACMSGTCNSDKERMTQLTINNSKVESQTDQPGQQKSMQKQLLCAFVINCVAFLQGASVPTSSVILHTLQDRHNTSDCQHSNTSHSLADFTVSEESGSWIASGWVLSHLMSACFAGFLNDAIGRRKCLLIDTAMFFLGFVVLCVSNSVLLLVVGRFLLGYPLVSQVFLSEVLSPGRLGLGAAMYSVLHSLGFFLVLILGAFLPWRWALAVPALLAVPVFCAVACLQESPEWLHKAGHREHALQAAIFYQKQIRSDSFLYKEKPLKKKDKDSVHKIVDKKNKLKMLISGIIKNDPKFIQNVLYLCFLFVCIGWCGFSIMSFYAVEIFKLSGSPLSAVNTSWIVSITKIGCSFASLYVLHKFNRKPLFLITGILVCISFLIMGLFTFLSTSSLLPSPLVSQLSWVPMVCVILAYSGYGLGYSVIPGILAAEIMPVEIRSTMAGLLMTLEMCSTLVLSKMKPVLLEVLGIHGLFTMFAGAVLIVIILTSVAMPNNGQAGSETNSKSLEPRRTPKSGQSA